MKMKVIIMLCYGVPITDCHNRKLDDGSTLWLCPQQMSVFLLSSTKLPWSPAPWEAQPKQQLTCSCLWGGRGRGGSLRSLISDLQTKMRVYTFVVDLLTEQVSEQMKYWTISGDSLSGALSLPYLRVVYLRLSTILNWNWRNVSYWKTGTIWTQIFPPKEQWAIGHQNIGSMNKENNCNYFGTWCCYIGQWYC